MIDQPKHEDHNMNYLAQGIESEEKIDLLLSLTSVRSESRAQAMKYYFCRGYTETMSYTLAEIPQQKFNSLKNRLNEIAGIVEKINEGKKNV